MGKLIDEISPDNSNDELEKELKDRFKDMMWQTLTFLEVALPHRKGDGSDNENRYNTIRQKVLRIGNDNIRELQGMFNSFVALKVYEYKKQVNPNIHTDVVNFKSKIKINGGKENE